MEGTGDIRKITLKASGMDFPALETGSGPLVLLLHGFPDHNRTWRLQMPALAAAGFRAIAPVMRGYSPSCQPRDNDYHVIRMAEDVLGWMDCLGETKCHLVGHDWGAIVTYASGTIAPDRFHSLTTLAVPHLRRMPTGLRELPGQIRNSWYMIFFQLRILADVIVERNDWAFIERLWRDWSPGWQWPPEEMAELKKTFGQPGVRKAALNYYRAFFDPLSQASRDTRAATTARINVPTLALTGEADGCMDTRLYDIVMRAEDFPGGLQVERVKGTGHFLHQENPVEVNRLVLNWIRAHQPETR
ncbi:MAG: alpha/beta hydrolase [Deltaproteobacteria bacterium]|nr:alpha/beta hydrolase [Deltaproteobacteria bacterium]